MSNYAQLENGKVINVVCWDGKGDYFDEFVMVEIQDDVFCSIGNFYCEFDGLFYENSSFEMIAGGMF